MELANIIGIIAIALGGAGIGFAVRDLVFRRWLVNEELELQQFMASIAGVAEPEPLWTPYTVVSAPVLGRSGARHFYTVIPDPERYEVGTIFFNKNRTNGDLSVVEAVETRLVMRRFVTPGEAWKPGDELVVAGHTMPAMDEQRAIAGAEAAEEEDDD